MSEQMKSFISVLGLFMAILLIVFILALLTPRLAKLVDKLVGKLVKKNNTSPDDDIYKVKSIYDLPREMKTESNQDTENNNKDGEEKNG